MSLRQSTGRAHDWDQDRLNRIRRAMIESERAFARVQGMNARAKLGLSTAAVGGFPYRARTCAEWTPLDAKLSRNAEKC